jgi:hypothetical protein
LLEQPYRNFLLVFRSFLFVLWRWGECFVELAWLTFLFNVGLAQFFVGVELRCLSFLLGFHFFLVAVGEMFG